MRRIRLAGLALAVAVAAAMAHPLLPLQADFLLFYASVFVCAVALSLVPGNQFEGLYTLSALRWGAQVTSFAAIACSFLLILSLVLLVSGIFPLRHPPTAYQLVLHVVLSGLGIGALAVTAYQLARAVAHLAAGIAVAPRYWRRLPVLGPVLGILLSAMLMFSAHQTYLSGRAQRALELAKQQAPQGQRFYVEQMRISGGGDDRAVECVVSFDAEGRRRTVTVRWRE